MATPALDLNLSYMRCGEAVREYLSTVKQGCPYGFYKIWRQFKKKTSYVAVRQMFWYLKEIGLIRPVRFVGDKTPFRKHLYELVPGQIESPAWWNCQKAQRQLSKKARL